MEPRELTGSTRKLVRRTTMNPARFQMLAVLERYQIGLKDALGRGTWISRDDLPRIREAMLADPLHGEVGSRIFTVGTSPVRHAYFEDFEEFLSR